MLNKKSSLHNYFYCKELIFIYLFIIFLGLKLHVFLFILGILLLFFVMTFFRNNLNLDHVKKNDIISPSSSEIIEVNQKSNNINIKTYLSPLDRHFMIAPTDCIVEKIEKKLKKNDEERVAYYLKDKQGKLLNISLIVKKLFKGPGVLGSWLIKLIYPKRIVSLCNEGDTLKRGERVGLIRFGSAMEYNFPKSYNISVKKEEHYSLGDTIGNTRNRIIKPYKKEEKESWKTDIFEKVDLLYFLLGFSCISGIFIYGYYRCRYIKKHTDMLEFSLFKNSKKYGIDGWVLSHYLFNLLIGFLYPYALRLTILLGSLWEVFEWYVGIYKPKILNGIGFCESPSGNKKNNKVWWYGKWQDIIANTLGFLTGKFLRKGEILF